MRWLIPFAVVLIGCVVSLPDDQSLSADLACESARLVVELRQQIAPTPASTVCENCGGTGTLGDGRVSVKCQACDGTGKRK